MKPRLAHRPLGLAVVGCGRISASHIDAILARPDHGRLVAVVDHDLQRAQAVAAEHRGVAAFGDLRRVFDLEAVEAVCICTPNDLHPAQTLLALEAGRHVLVEKPMAESLAEAAAMARMADETGLILAVGMTLRHSAPIRYIQEHRGQFGALRAIEVSQCVFWDGPQAPWWKTRTPEQGLILSLLAPHALDFVQLMMGDDPLAVRAISARRQGGWIGEDEAMIILGYPEGRLASVHLSYNQPFVVDRKVVSFEGCVARIEDGDALWIGDRLVLDAGDPSPDSRHAMGARDLSAYFRNQFEEFSRAVWGLKHASVLHDEGRRLVQLTEAVIRASVGSETAP